MIKVDKGFRLKELDTDDVDLALEKLEEFYLSKNRNQKRYNFPFKSKIDKSLKFLLDKRFYSKCGYCETKITTPDFGIVDRFRPNNGIRDKSEYFEDLYWWLTYDWENLIYSCKTCSQYKANYFPITGKRALSEKDSLEEEQPLLINPCIEDPTSYFSYDIEGNIYSNEKKGIQTIELLRLNRTDLLNSRKQAKEDIIDIIEKLLVGDNKDSLSNQKIDYLKRIYEYEDFPIEFLSFKRWVLIEALETEPFLGGRLDIEEYSKFPNVKKALGKEQEKKITRHDILKSDYFPLEYIEIENFKSISKLRIDFKEDSLEKKSWLFLLGENGVGKSSILQAFAIGLKNNLSKDKILKYNLIKQGEEKAIIRIKERDKENIIETTITKKGDIINQKGNFDSFLLGYGSLRLSSTDVNLNVRNDLSKISYANLFDPILALNDITKWLKDKFQNSKSLFDQVAYAIKNLLPHDYVDNELTIKKGNIAFRNSDVLFNQLSDGFKSTIVLAVDIMMKLSSTHADFDKVSGIVIIDELGNQLHPRWQMRIVKQLRSVFPKLNFIVSTHHPLCLRGTEEQEILLLKNVDNKVVPINELPDTSSLRVDQILASEFFGLSSLIDPELEAKFNRYYELLAKTSTSREENIELDRLRDELGNKKQLGATLREELMYHVIDKLLAEKVSYNDEGIQRIKLKDEVVKRVSDLWNNLKLNEDD